MNNRPMNQPFDLVSNGNAYYGAYGQNQPTQQAAYEAQYYGEPAPKSGGLWSGLQNAFIDLFFDEVEDDRPIGISRLTNQTFNNTSARLNHAPTAATPSARGNFVQDRNQFYKSGNIFAQDFRYERLAGQKPKAKTTDDYLY